MLKKKKKKTSQGLDEERIKGFIQLAHSRVREGADERPESSGTV